MQHFSKAAYGVGGFIRLAYENGDFQKDLHKIEAAVEKSLQGLVLFYLENGRKQEVHTLLEKMKAESPQANGIQICKLLAILGDRNAYRENARGRLSDKNLLPSHRDILELYAGDIDAKTFLERSSGSAALTARLVTCGVTMLTENKRDKAREYFERAINEGLFITQEYQYAKTYLKQMENESWPHWMSSTGEGEGERNRKQRTTTSQSETHVLRNGFERRVSWGVLL